ncbi:MAG: SpoIIE family protein phosphatase [bacterium]|nr:SpoIIE family protein phosphatase [bacterium]
MLIIRKSGGRVINDFFEPNLEDAALKLNSGDTLVLYTDGISEAQKQPASKGVALQRLSEPNPCRSIFGNRPRYRHSFFRIFPDHPVSERSRRPGA